MPKLQSSESLTVTVSNCPIVQLDAWAGELSAFESKVAQDIGGPLPAETGQITVHGDLTIARARPGRFWVFSANAPFKLSIPPELGCALHLSEGRIRIKVGAANLRRVVSKCLAIDWEASEGVATFTSMHRIPVLFMRSSASDGEFIVPRTFAQSIQEWLEECL
ncbi:hypothetical protein LAC81_26515 [Ensifer adhaerens]|uniref:hypothetical protein n=1 Tax=Ensifer adhaerens TaxID=106592 RepID=UPI001CBBDB0F|nr:hypothetical protein [Ensifer adhaerens]MBZ7924282.1 hypothetical protein [Ensifer adhaerens]UAX96467.1 hypothetical protein LAC78_21970 [Ensifer adhaerens]UAY04190.1 hypothetical protein LAC80_22990 [Ensifer adhaerens]UAY12176.1 hypothetical protein LAC81_26515 [Ensifer adhaerens]